MSYTLYHVPGSVPCEQILKLFVANPWLKEKYVMVDATTIPGGGAELKKMGITTVPTILHNATGQLYKDKQSHDLIFAQLKEYGSMAPTASMSRPETFEDTILQEIRMLRVMMQKEFNQLRREMTGARPAAPRLGGGASRLSGAHERIPVTGVPDDVETIVGEKGHILKPMVIKRQQQKLDLSELMRGRHNFHPPDAI